MKVIRALIDSMSGVDRGVSTGLNLKGVLPCLAVGLMFTTRLSATTYYVSASTGCDTYSSTQAQSISTPWKTIQTAANAMSAGDTCLIQSGTYRETVTVARSGVAGSLITFRADVGQTVTLSGTEIVGGTGWTLESANIYYAPMAWTLGDANQVFNNGAMRPEARWPNASTSSYPFPATPANGTFSGAYWSYVTGTGSFSGTYACVTDSNLPSRADGYWNGALLHVMAGCGWFMQNAVVSTYSASVKTFTTSYVYVDPADYRTITSGNEYYITGKKGELDSDGEWFCDGTNSRLYYYSSTGAPSSIEAKRRYYGFDLSGRAYVQIVGLNFSGCTIKTSTTSANCTFDGLTMRYLGHHQTGTSSGTVNGLVLGDGFVLRNSDLSYDSRYLVQLAGSNIRVINNNIHHSGYETQMEAVLALTSGTFSAKTVQGNLISHNSIHDAGRGLIGNCGGAAIIEYNDVYNGMRLSTDGGLFYAPQAVGGNSIVRYNLFHDAYGPTSHTGNSSEGFYLDSYGSNWVIHHNIIWNVPGYAIQINGRFNFDMIFNNTCLNAGKGGLGSWFDIDGRTGTNVFNNILVGVVTGTTWNSADLRYNLYSDPLCVDPANRNFQLQAGSPAIGAGTLIPGITDGYVGGTADLGALEYGGTDWTGQCGYKGTAPNPDPTYSLPSMVFSNAVRDGSFESGSLSPNWTSTTTSTAVSLAQGNCWSDAFVRSRFYSVQCHAGTTEIKQTVTGLSPNRRYALYVGARGTESISQVIKYGVRNFGYPVVEGLAAVDSQWHMNRLTFVTGTSSTSAEIYANVTNPNGATNKVYLDDFSVQPCQEIDDPQPQVMPFVHYTFDEGTGTVAYDRSTRGYDATLSGATAWGAGVYNGAASFNGTNSYVLSPTFSSPTSVSIACWAKSGTATWNANYCLASKRPSFLLHPTAGSKRMNFIIYVGTSSQWICADMGDITGWHHYVGTYDQATGMQAIYVDGVLKCAYTNPSFVGQPLVTTSSQLSIGKDGSNYLNGSVDDVRVYNYALAGSEIAALGSLDTTKVLHYKFDDGTGATKAWDYSFNGSRGVLTNVNPATDWVSGKDGGAILLNGTNSYVVTPSFATPGSVTVACWAKSGAATWNANYCLASKRPSFLLHPTAGSKRMNFIVYVGTSTQWICSDLDDVTAWHYYVGTYNQATGNQSLYVDGVLKFSYTNPNFVGLPLAAGTTPLYIGKDGSGYLNGTVDDVRVYSRALNANEVIDLTFPRNMAPYAGY